jgi:hypothetical protein
MALRFPNFIVPGAQKAGTTTLHQLLSQHPEIYLPRCKEVQYFSLHAHESPSWYAEYFKQAGPEQQCGDITPYYLFHPEAPARIAQLLPDIKLIILLRDPVERCLSQYFHACRLGFESLGLQEALAAESQRLKGAEIALNELGARHRGHQENSYRSRSQYDIQLNRYLQYFNKDQILVLKSEELFQEPQRIWTKVLTWLEIDPLPLPDQLPCANSGLGEAASIPGSWRQELRQDLEPTYKAMAQNWNVYWEEVAN